MDADLVERARNGDEIAFGHLVDGHRRELEVHCYRMLGSVQDAEDVLQETFLAAWQGLARFEGRASVRTWLYRIATNRCLNARRSARRRPVPEVSGLDVVPPAPTRLGEIVWLEPYPDRLLQDLAERDPGPEGRYAQRASISLAFVTALQLLPARQRAVLVLRDVLGFRAAEVASILDTTEESVTSALKRARATLARRLPEPEADMATTPSTPAEAELVDLLTCAWEAADVDGIVALLAEDVWLTMPPLPLEYQGRDLTAVFLTAVAFRDGRTYRLVPTRANGSPAFGVYLNDRDGGDAHAVGLLAVTWEGGLVTSLTRFENGVLARFGLPRSLPHY